MYNKLKNIQQLLWRNDDRMDQEVLFEIQDEFANILLEIAAREDRVEDLINSFPWLYKRK